jgi:CubicO group peptidase (beta-lactamase class C family)
MLLLIYMTSIIEKALLRRSKKYRISGFSIQVIEDFKLGARYFSGSRDKNKSSAINRNTLFQAASLSKTITAIIALRMVEEKTIGFADVKALLNHSAGISVSSFKGYEIGSELPSLNEIVTGTYPCNSAPIRKKYQKGKYHYSGGGYVLAQKVLEKTSVKTLEQLAKRFIFTPLGLKRSTFKLLYPGNPKNIAVGHTSRNQLKGEWKQHPESAAAGLWTTSLEMAKVIIELRKALKGDSTVFSKELAERMLYSEIKGIGLGTFVCKTKTGIEFTHAGANVGYRSHYIDLPNGKGAVILVNSDSGFEFINEVLPILGNWHCWGKFKTKL